MGNDEGWYDVAQICLNGHNINSLSKTYLNSNSSFCSDCGKKTITCCEKCNGEIRGYYHASIPIGSFYSVPSYCLECGNAYPWTVSKIQALKELADDLEEISDADKQKLIESIDHVLTETPKTTLASSRFKSILNKVTPEHKQMIKKYTLRSPRLLG